MNYRQARNRLRLLTGNKLDDARAGDLVNHLVESLWSESWSFRFKDAVLMTVAPVSAGTVSTNVDPTKIDGVGTSWTAAMVDRYFRAAPDVSFYKIVAVVGQQLTLENAYPGTLVTSAYEIFQHIYPLEANVDSVRTMAYWQKLGEGTPEQADRWDVRRSYQSDHPWQLIYHGETAAGTVLVEIVPVPSAAIPLRYSYLAKAPVYVPGTDDTVLIPLPADALTYLGAAEGLYTWCAEHPETPGVAALLQLAARREAQGQQALQAALYTDLKKSSPALAVRDLDEAGWMDGEYRSAHDYESML